MTRTRNWAICIGVNEYQNLPSLNYAVTDAGNMRDWFIDEAGFGKDDVYLFTDDSPPILDASKPYRSQPTYANVIRFLANRFNEKFLAVGDNLWFYFSGHGMRNHERDYLMLSDSSADDELIEKTAIPLSYVTERLRRSGADNVVIVQDACRHELKTKGLGVGEEHQTGVITFASCSPDTRSYEIEELKHGSFTYAFLESLRLQGEANCATVERLDQRLRYRVAQINQQYKKPCQIPCVSVEPATKYNLILLPKQATLRDIDRLKMFAQEAELERDLLLAEQTWTRILAVSPADPQALKALRRIWQQIQEQPLQFTSPSKSAEVTSTDSSLKVFKPDILAINSKEPEIKLEYISEHLGKGVTLEMVPIPAGSFVMGSPKSEKNSFHEERPQHEVTVPAFFMGKYQVTQLQWRMVAFMPKVKEKLSFDPSHFKDDNRPVERVSWLDTVEFCARLSNHTGQEYRLPSEAEWEYACRAGMTTPFSFGETITPKLANYNGEYPYGSLKGKYRKETSPVGSFPPNDFGLYDMHGNVWEWCADDWHDNYEGAPADASVWTEIDDTHENIEANKVLRGGSWYHFDRYCRSACRNRYGAIDLGGHFGFRVVCVLR